MGTTIGLTGAAEPVALQSDLEALTARVTKLESEIHPVPPPVLTPSPTNTFATAPGTTIVDDKLNQWSLVATPGKGNQIQLMAHGTTTWAVDPPTQNVTELGIQLVPPGGVRTIVQKNTAGNCYENDTGVLGAWGAFPGPVPP